MLPTFADENINGAIVRGLLRWGMDVITVHDRMLAGRIDEEILPAATAEGRLLLTNDEDFLAIHSAWLMAGKDHAGIVYWNPNRLTIGDAIHRIVGLAARTSTRDAISQLIYL